MILVNQWPQMPDFQRLYIIFVTYQDTEDAYV